MDFFDDDPRGLRKKKTNLKHLAPKLAVIGVVGVLLVVFGVQHRTSRNNINKLQQERDAAVQKSQQLERTLRDREVVMNSKDSQLADTRRQLAQQRSDVTRLTREATEQRRQHELSSDDLTTCESDRHDANIKLATVRRELEDARRALDFSQRSSADLQRKLDAETQHHTNLESSRLSQIAGLERELSLCKSMQLQQMGSGLGAAQQGVPVQQGVASQQGTSVQQGVPLQQTVPALQTQQQGASQQAVPMQQGDQAVPMASQQVGANTHQAQQQAATNSQQAQQQAVPQQAAQEVPVRQQDASGRGQAQGQVPGAQQQEQRVPPADEGQPQQQQAVGRPNPPHVFRRHASRFSTLGTHLGGHRPPRGQDYEGGNT